ncbi:MAG: hypothetical protein WBP26_05880 [Candidatus Saccharimonadales bacterium]
MKKNTKTNKATKKNRFITPTRAIIAGLVAMVILLTFTVAVMAGRDKDNPEQTRELVISAVRAVKKDAPVDAKTGDIYFPEYRLYIPNPGMVLPLTYLADEGNVSDSQGELSVSTWPVFGSTSVYMTQTTNELFDAVPKLQACSRGVKIVSHKYPASDTQNQFKHEVRLNNHKTVYIYVEKACPELNPLADKLANIKAY